MTYRDALAAILIYVGGSIEAQNRNWTETATETIWRVRYTNCDKGWAVNLPKGVVAHNSLPPNPNHGFLISSANPGTPAEVKLDQHRIIAIYDHYDALELGNARAYLDRELKDASRKTALEIREATLQGLRGVRARYRVSGRVSGAASDQVVESFIFMRHGVVHHFLLKTTELDYQTDASLFARIRAGFVLLPFPKGACINP